MLVDACKMFGSCMIQCFAVYLKQYQWGVTGLLSRGCDFFYQTVEASRISGPRAALQELLELILDSKSEGHEEQGRPLQEMLRRTP